MLEIHPLQKVLTVSQLTGDIKTLLEDVFLDVHVVGEISNAKIHPSGHWYFSLKDKEATLPCASFKNINQYFKFRLEDGLMMVATGRLSVYPPRGAYQLIVTSLTPVGIGDWQLAFEQLKKQLEEEGLLHPDRKRPIPILPRKIGVVTSLSGAALQDILSALGRRNKNVSIVIAQARVQGEGSVAEIVQALLDLQQDSTIEVIIIARGGGSIEDLWSFNTELVARAVANSRIPVISGVGHETDITICDLVADMRAPTPTAAAELVARGTAEIIERWKFLHIALLQILRERLTYYRQTLIRLHPLNFLSLYQARLHKHKLELQHLRTQLISSTSRILALAQSHFRENNQRLLSLGPTNVMKRGFALLRNAQGDLVRSVSQVKPNETLTALLAEGKLTLTVQDKNDEWY